MRSDETLSPTIHPWSPPVLKVFAKLEPSRDTPAAVSTSKKTLRGFPPRDGTWKSALYLADTGSWSR